jgi:hypothetical protein
MLHKLNETPPTVDTDNAPSTAPVRLSYRNVDGMDPDCSSVSLARHVRSILIRKDSGIKRSFGEVHKKMRGSR